MPDMFSRIENILQATIDGVGYNELPKSRVEYLLLQLKAVIEGGGGGVSDYTDVIDSSLSTTSENPVQNKVITTALNGKVSTVTGKGLSTNDYTNAEKTSVALSAEILTPISESAYEALTTKDKPLYFIYD